MRIDAHQHFWDLDRFHYTWMPPGDSVLRRNYLPADLRTVLEDNRFDGAVLVQANTHLDETHWFLQLATENPWILGVVGWVDLTSPRLSETLDQLQQHPKFKGVRHPVHDEDDTRWILRDDVLLGLAELARRGLPYDLLLRPIHLPLIPLIVERVPHLRMVIDHIAKPFIAGHSLDGWQEDIAAAARFPQLYCKLSGMITEADPKSWQAADLRPYVQHVLNVFGPERLMFGTDWPVCKLAGSWKQVLAAFTQAIGAQPQHVRDRLLGDTAAEFYRLAVEAPPSL
jgi:L-fuconolactonase